VGAVEFLGPDGPMAKAMPNYEHRPGQLRMTERVEEALEHGGALLVEAGTGTGKTMAYLVPAVLSGLRVVISTGTKNLQDQIMGEDLPRLEKSLGQSVGAVCMKGLANYLCRRRYGEFLHSPASLKTKPNQLKILDEWQQTSQEGDRSELESLSEDDPIWGQVTSSPETRVGPRCAYYEECFVTDLRRRADQARLIVVNHHLFFADLALRGSRGMGVIPEYDAVIFDEAHQIEDVATNFFGVRISTSGIERLVADARRSFARSKEVKAPTRELESILSSAFEVFEEARKSMRNTREETSQPLNPEAMEGGLLPAFHTMDNSLDAFALHAQRVGKGDESILQVVKRAQRMRESTALIAESRGKERVAWAKRQGRGVTIGSSPIDVSEILREELFSRTPSVVLTSATLSADNKFDFIKRRLGIDFEIEEEIVSSPFDFAKQSSLYLPSTMPEPRDPRFVEQAVEEIDRLVTLVSGGAFVLCTSYRVMRSLAELLADRLPFPQWVQGDAPKHRLLDRFREAGDGVLFATSSFWEGVDVPGDALRLVILDKLPFSVPTDPLVEARCRRLEAEGERPFPRYLVPSAALSLKQGFGRLIRTRRDRGIVAILDSRMTSKGYGKVFLRSLPAARRASSFEDLQEHWMGSQP